MMQKMIYGVGPNTMMDDWDDSDGEFQYSPFSVYITDEQTWVNEHHCNDSCVDQTMRKKLQKAGLSESQESIFEPKDADMTEEQIHDVMEKLGYIHSAEFGKWMASALGY